MPQVHRHSDSRVCGATTTASNHKNVWVNNLQISVNGDPNSHGGGNLKANCKQVYVGGNLVVLNGNPAGADALCGVPWHRGHGHCGPNATSGSPNVHIGYN